ncbi:MAG TPA: hypothetical protein PLI22_02815 [Caldisericia bacterium]|nr:hypothetical protein [Caldisericia bacterium]
MIYEKFKELTEFKDEKGISFYSNINVSSYKNELLSFAKMELIVYQIKLKKRI